MRRLEELPKDAKLETRNLKLETGKNITATRDKQNANAGSDAKRSGLIVRDLSGATEDKVMRRILWQGEGG